MTDLDVCDYLSQCHLSEPMYQNKTGKKQDTVCLYLIKNFIIPILF